MLVTIMPQRAKPIPFEVNLTKMKWCPKQISEIPQVISRAFERDISMKQIAPILGTDHVKEWVLKEDKDIPEFYNAPTMMQEWIAEKVIKVKIPDGIIPKDFQPKKVKILATGQKMAKFFGEDHVSTRTVECSIKLFDCNHFYMKQTLPGSGASPHWTIFEGRWHQTERGIRLEYLLRYSWQLSQKPAIEFAVEACRSDLITSLAWDGETEKQLNGNLPAIVGTDDYFWAELVREGDTTGEAKIRWNEDCPEPPSWVHPKGPDMPAPTPAPQPSPPSALESKGTAATPSATTTAQPAGATQRRRPAEDAKPAAPAPRPSPSPPPPKSAAEQQAEREKIAAGQEPDVESPWPVYIGFVLFLVMTMAFTLSTWEERS